MEGARVDLLPTAVAAARKSNAQTLKSQLKPGGDMNSGLYPYFSAWKHAPQRLDTWITGCNTLEHTIITVGTSPEAIVITGVSARIYVGGRKLNFAKYAI